MTTTKHRPSWQIRREIREIEIAVESTEKPLAPVVIEAFTARLGAEGFAKMEAETTAWLVEQRERLVALRAECESAEEGECGRCQGTGNYRAPTGRTINGRPVCFACGGTGRARKRR